MYTTSGTTGRDPPVWTKQKSPIYPIVQTRNDLYDFRIIQIISSDNANENLFLVTSDSKPNAKFFAKGPDGKLASNLVYSDWGATQEASRSANAFGSGGARCIINQSPGGEHLKGFRKK